MLGTPRTQPLRSAEQTFNDIGLTADIVLLCAESARPTDFHLSGVTQSGTLVSGGIRILNLRNTNHLSTLVRIR